MQRPSNWEQRAVSAADVISHIKSGDNVFIHGASATPTPLLEALCKREDLEGVQLYHLHLAGPCAFADPPRPHALFSNSLFTGPSLRKPIAEGDADFVPIFLSDIPYMFRNGIVPLDVAVLQLSPPDKHGHCTLGTSVDTALAAAKCAKIVIAEINEQMPRTTGNTHVAFDQLAAFMTSNRPILEHPAAPEGPVEAAIGELIADLVEDGSTLQMGIGSIPDAVLTRLGNKVDLGVHTEMFSDKLVPLVHGGVITNRYKEVHPGRTVSSFVTGTRMLFDFVDDNLSVEMHPCERTNDTHLIAKNPRTVAINSALEIDLSGQVCADSIGHRIYSGIGGQMDFIRGAARSPGGKPIIALPATAKRGQLSRIVPTLKPGAGVVTTRGHVHWVVTEFGRVNLHGLALRRRGEALISIAHPDFRSELAKELMELRHFDLGRKTLFPKAT